METQGNALHCWNASLCHFPSPTDDPDISSECRPISPQDTAGWVCCGFFVIRLNLYTPGRNARQVLLRPFPGILFRSLCHPSQTHSWQSVFIPRLRGWLLGVSAWRHPLTCCYKYISAHRHSETKCSILVKLSPLSLSIRCCFSLESIIIMKADKWWFSDSMIPSTFTRWLATKTKTSPDGLPDSKFI